MSFAHLSKGLLHMKKLIFSLCLLGSYSFADDVAVPNTFSPDTTISSSEVNANFTALVDESNENDARIQALESVEAAGKPVWVDADGDVVGMLGPSRIGALQMLVKYPDYARVVTLLSNLDTSSDQRWLNASTHYDQRDCEGTAYFQQYGSMGSSSFKYDSADITVGVTKLGHAVFPDFSHGPILGPSSDPVALSRLDINVDGSLRCVNQETDYGTQAWVLGIVSSNNRDLGITLPVRLEWR